MRFYAVTCKHGHCGARKYYPITFAIAANTAIDACIYAMAMPGVKHDQTVIRCEEITFAAYAELRRRSAYERAGLK